MPDKASHSPVETETGTDFSNKKRSQRLVAAPARANYGRAPEARRHLSFSGQLREFRGGLTGSQEVGDSFRQVALGTASVQALLAAKREELGFKPVEAAKVRFG